MNIYENIKKYRKLRKMSQDELAHLVGYTDRSTIAKIESGRMQIPQDKILLIATALSVTPDQLYGIENINMIPYMKESEFKEIAHKVLSAYLNSSSVVKVGINSMLNLDMNDYDYKILKDGIRNYLEEIPDDIQ